MSEIASGAPARGTDSDSDDAVPEPEPEPEATTEDDGAGAEPEPSSAEEGVPPGEDPLSRTSTVAALLDFLISAGIKPEKAEQHAAGFAAQDVDVHGLEDLTEDELKKDFGLLIGEAKKVIKALGTAVKSTVAKDWSLILAEEEGRRDHLQAAVEGWKAGRWAIKDPAVGQGGGGVVFSSSDTHLGTVALKFMHGDEPKKPQREADLMQRVAHEHVCKLHESRVLDGGLFVMVMEMLDGGSLAERMLPQGGSEEEAVHLPELEVIDMGADILSALAHMHGMGVIHRDVKPGTGCRRLRVVEHWL